jgi:hypothetical protein
MTAVVDVIPAQPKAEPRPIAWEKAWWVPLAAILTAQAWLSVLVMHGTVASPDEARYITAGHQLIYELWHGGGSPFYETYFSGAPVIYSPLAAMADHLGGLVAVRLMSLVLMLAATVVLYATAKRLFGYWAGIAAAALFAGNGLTHDLGVYANYDALALLLLACATYCAVRSREERWLLLMPLALLGANATKYMTVLFDPVIIGIAALQVSQHGWLRVGKRMAILGITVATTLILAACLAGTAYITGVMFTTLDRPRGTNPILAAISRTPRFIVLESASWLGAVIALGAVAVIVARRWDRAALLALLVAAGVVVTVEALHLRSDESMRQHDDLGLWFACIAAGYVIAEIPRVIRWRPAKYTAAALAAVGVVVLGHQYSSFAAGTYEGKATYKVVKVIDFASAVRPYLQLPGARYELGGITDFQAVYMDRVNVPWFNLFDDIYLKYPIPGRGGDSHGQARGRACLSLRPGCMYLEGPAAYSAAIHAHYFALISMEGSHNGTANDKAIQQAVAGTPGYVLLTRAGGAPTWIYASAYEGHTHAR